LLPHNCRRICDVFQADPLIFIQPCVRASPLPLAPQGDFLHMDGTEDIYGGWCFNVHRNAMQRKNTWMIGTPLNSLRFPARCSLGIKLDLVFRIIAGLLACSQALAGRGVDLHVVLLCQLTHDQLLRPHLVCKVVLGRPVEAINMDGSVRTDASKHYQ
jgi:hypothetical protein